MIAFLAGLHVSGLFKPSLVVCPATMLRQWLREFRKWHPPFRVALLHDAVSGGGGGGGGHAANGNAGSGGGEGMERGGASAAPTAKEARASARARCSVHLIPL